MKIIDAVWEKRNLGVSCYEVLFDSEDTLEEIKSSWLKFEEREYLVFKIPTNRVDIVDYVQKQGCKFIEVAMVFEADLRTWTLPEYLKPICEKCSYAPMNQEEIDFMLSEIANGVFKTDRVYLDSYFTHKQAAQRYINWAQDSLKQGDIAYKSMYQGETIGFAVGALGGVYSQFEGTGMGLCSQYVAIKRDIDKGEKFSRGNYSSNNTEMLRILSALNKNVVSMSYVFVKHISHDKESR